MTLRRWGAAGPRREPDRTPRRHPRAGRIGLIDPPTTPACSTLAESGALDPALASRLALVARQRNVLVHLYLDIDDREVFAALGRLDDLRQFGAAAQELADRPNPG